MTIAEVDDNGVVLLIDDVGADNYLSLVSLLNKTTHLVRGEINA